MICQLGIVIIFSAIFLRGIICHSLDYFFIRLNYSLKWCLPSQNCQKWISVTQSATRNLFKHSANTFICLVNIYNVSTWESDIRCMIFQQKQQPWNRILISVRPIHKLNCQRGITVRGFSRNCYSWLNSNHRFHLYSRILLKMKRFSLLAMN